MSPVLDDLAAELQLQPEQLRERLTSQLLPDQIQPNYLTADAQGRVGANFAGHVHAQGLDLDAGTSSTPPDTDRVRWLRTSDGIAIAYAAGIEPNPATSTESELLLEADSRDGQSFCRLRVGASNDAGIPSRILFDVARGVGSSQIGELLMDDGGKSSFVQLAGNAQAQRAIAAGTGTFTWSGSAVSGMQTITHGLQRVPIAVVGQAHTGGSARSFNADTFTSNTFRCYGSDTVAVTGSDAFWWIAFG